MGSGTYWHLVVAVTILLAVTATILGRNATDCSPRDHLPCTVTKPGCLPDEKPPPKEGWPGKPKDLNVTTFMREFPDPKYAGKKYPGMNITWRIPDDISYKYIKGFQLTALVMSGPNVDKRHCRTFDLSRAQWNSTDLKDKVMFYYDGHFPCAMKATYYIQLYSLPKADVEHSGNYIDEYIVTPGAETMNPSNPANWVTAMNFHLIPASNQINVWFKLAPPSFRFVQYDVMLVSAIQEDGRASNQWTHKTEVVVQKGETGYRQVTFLKVCSGNYTINVQPTNTGKYTSECVCKDESGMSAEFCAVSSSAIFKFVSGSIPCLVTSTKAISDTTQLSHTPPSHPASPTTPHARSMVTSRMSSHPAIPTTPHAQSVVTSRMSSQETTNGGSGNQSGDKMAAIIVGVVMGVILLVVILVLVYRRKGYSGSDGSSCPPWKKTPVTVTRNVADLNNIAKPASAPEGVEISRKCRVLLVYSNDHPLHLAVVHHLAQFLNANCGCNVRFDQWSLDEIRRHSYVTWLWQEIEHAERIIIVNSLGAYRQHEAHKENASYCNIADDSPPHDDGFLIAMETIKNRFGKTLSCSYDKLIMVYFPYTSETQVLRDINPGHRYKLMKHIEDVVLHLHGLQRFNPDSVQFIGGGINYSHYHQLTWGEPLADSINKMAAYVSSQPNWFDHRFTLVRSDSGFSSEGVEMEDLSDSPRDASVGFSDVGQISVVAPVLGDWLSGKISETVAQFNEEYEQQQAMDYASGNLSVMDDCSIGGTSI